MKTFESVSLSPMQRKVWESFSKKTSYAKEISFDEVLVTIGHLIEIIFKYAVQELSTHQFSIYKTHIIFTFFEI